MPIVTPIIINQGRGEVNCIIESGVKYCEKEVASKKELGAVLLLTLAILVWAFFWIHIAIDEESPIFALVCGVFVPMGLGGLYLFFF